MADPLKKPGEDRARRETAARGAYSQGSGTGTDPDLGAVNSLPEERTTLSETRTTETTVPDTKSMSERITPGMTPEDRARSQAETAHTTTREGRPTTEKIGEKPHDVKEDVKEKVEPGRATLTEQAPRTIPLAGRTTPSPDVTKGPDWNQIQNPASCGPEGEADYGTRPISELAPPSTVSDKADLAAQRMLDREKADREKMDRERIMSTATLDAAAARAAMTSKEMTPAEIEAERERMKAGAGEEMAPAGTQGQHWRGEPWTKNPKVGGKETAEAEAETARGRMMTEPGAAGAVAMTPAEIEAERARTKTGAAVAGAAAATGAAAKKAESEAERERRMKTGAVVGGAALAAGAAATRTSPEAGERTTRQGAAVDTPPPYHAAPERLVTGTTAVVPPGVETTKPLKPYGTVDERARMHAEDPSVHADWETQPQINAPRDVGIPTAEGQADAARLRAGERRSDTAKEPRIDRRGGEYDVPVASGARMKDTGTTTERRMGTETKDDRTMTEKMRDEAHKAKEVTKEKARDVKEDVDRKI